MVCGRFADGWRADCGWRFAGGLRAVCRRLAGVLRLAVCGYDSVTKYTPRDQQNATPNPIKLRNAQRWTPSSSLLKTKTMCVCMYGCMDVCQFPLAAYYEKVARARMVKFSHKIRPVQPFVVLKFRGCAINGVHVRGASLPHFGSGRRRRRVTRAELRFLAVKTERFIPDN